MPVAVNCWLLPVVIEAFAGVTAIETSDAAVTESVVDPQILPTLALMVVLPVATPVARPAGEIAATLVVDEFQVAVEVKSMVLPSL